MRLPSVVVGAPPSAERGELNSQIALCGFLVAGDLVPKDEVEALAWMHVAVALGASCIAQKRDDLEVRLGGRAALTAQNRGREIWAKIEIARENMVFAVLDFRFRASCRAHNMGKQAHRAGMRRSVCRAVGSTVRVAGGVDKGVRYRLEIGDEALRHLRALPKEQRKRIGEKLDALQTDLRGDVKKLAGQEGKYRLRVGALRLLFTLEKDLIFVHVVKDRKDAYRD